MELLIAIGLFAILVSIAAAGYINALRTDREVSALISAQSNAGLALEEIAREARTGYLFCHTLVGNAPANCGVCTTASSPVGPTWTCPALDFYNADSQEVTYATSSGEITRSVGGGAPDAITADNVDIKSLQFILQGQLEGDQWNPRITILMQVAPSSTDPALTNDVLNLQTTVSAREIDCGAVSGC